MTTSTNQGVAQGRHRTPLDAAWREATLARQLGAVPAGRTIVTCSAPLGIGGLGRHLSEIATAVERSGNPGECIDGGARATSPGRMRPSGVLARSSLPLSPGVRTRAFTGDFDAYAAARLPAADALIAFNGQALHQLKAARSRGFSSLGLVSANSHLRQVARRHAEARRRYPLEGSWTAHLLERNLAEYALAERIYVSSGYVRESFLREGFAEERLLDFPLTPDPRYAPAASATPAAVAASRASDLATPPAVDVAAAPTALSAAGSGRFEVVYVGSLAVHKGVPLLIDAIRRLPYEDLRLVLVGGWGTRGMRRFVQSACAEDARIVVRPGDPLEQLHRASVCVHPAYEDGFAYAPAEALACGVPVIVSEDTGMKELIDAPSAGLVLPTGEGQALAEAIEAAYRGELPSSSR